MPNCSKCIHFYITLDERRPRACRVFNIKCVAFPSVEVKRNTGYDCPVFKEREVKQRPIIKEDSLFNFYA